MSKELIWDMTLDNRFGVNVHKKEDYIGELIIIDSEDNKEIFKQEVPLMYNAEFGPDIEDVQNWQSIAIDFVDNKYNKTI